MRWQVEATINHIAPRIGEVPRLAFSQLYIFQNILTQIFNQCLLLRLSLNDIKTIGVGSSLSVIGQNRCLISQRESIDQIFCLFHLLDLAIGRIQRIKTHVVTILSREVDLSVSAAPNRTTYTRIKILRQRLDFLCSNVHQIKLSIGHTRCLALFHILTYAIECLR